MMKSLGASCVHDCVADEYQTSARRVPARLRGLRPTIKPAVFGGCCTLSAPYLQCFDLSRRRLYATPRSGSPLSISSLCLLTYVQTDTVRGPLSRLRSYWHNLPTLVGRDICSQPSEPCNMPTRNVVLSEHQQQLVESLVQSGRYQNASEVLRDGLRLVEERDRRENAKLKALRQAARKGWADVSAGRYTDVADDELEDFVGQLGRRASQAAKTAS
jgi:antitoxin ParD1/3/4